VVNGEYLQRHHVCSAKKDRRQRYPLRRRCPEGAGLPRSAAAPLYYILAGFMEFPGRTTRMFAAAFMPFIEQRPIGVMARAILERFFEPEHLDVLFRRTAVQQYERNLLFSSVVDLMQSVVLG